MSIPASKDTGAITDLYDEQNNTILVQYPPLLVVGLGLTGVIAFSLTGFLGYIPLNTLPRNAPFLDWVFHEPWLLFFWFCALMLTLQISIFRNVRVRRQRDQTIIVSLISIVLVILLYFYRDQLQFLGEQIGNFLRSLHIPIGEGIVYALINFAIIVIFWVDTIRRWIRRIQGKPIAPQIDLFQRETNNDKNSPLLMPSLAELVSGDLIAGGVLTFFLFILFSPTTINAIAASIGSSGAHQTCAFQCEIIDRNQSLIYIPLGLLTLALTAMVNGLAALNAVDRTVVDVVPVDTNPNERGTDKGTKGVVQTIIETLLSAVSRQFQGILRNLALGLRTASWPMLIFIGTAALAVAARYNEYYLHATSCAHVAASCDSIGYNHSDFAQQMIYGGIILAAALIAILCITFAASLLIYNQRVADNTLRFIGLIAFVVLLTFWIFSLALSVFNSLLWVTVVSIRVPFPQPGITTSISFAALVIYAAILLINRRRRHDTTPFLIPQIGERTFRKHQQAAAAGKVTVATTASETPGSDNIPQTPANS